jgi:hypothetical protein
MFLKNFGGWREQVMAGVADNYCNDILKMFILQLVQGVYEMF